MNLTNILIPLFAFIVFIVAAILILRTWLDNMGQRAIDEEDVDIQKLIDQSQL